MDFTIQYEAYTCMFVWIPRVYSTMQIVYYDSVIY